MPLYTEKHAKAGLNIRLPKLESFPNQYPKYVITFEIPEFTSVCPRTNLPDFGVLELRYMPLRWCVELKSLKMYLNSYRHLGIFQENAVNRILGDVVNASKPAWAVLKGTFNARGGITTIVEACYPLPSSGGPPHPDAAWPDMSRASHETVTNGNRDSGGKSS